MEFSVFYRFLKRKWLPALPVVLLTLLPVISVEAMDIPLDLQIQIFLKIMTYDRAISLGKGEPFRVGIVSLGNEGEKRLLEVQKSLSDKTIMGAPIVAIPIKSDFNPPDLFSQPPHILILFPLADEKLLKVLNYAKAQKILTFGTEPDFLRYDIGVVLTLEEGKPLINLNLSLAKQAGADFHANFLKLCRIFR